MIKGPIKIDQDLIKINQDLIKINLIKIIRSTAILPTIKAFRPHPASKIFLDVPDHQSIDQMDFLDMYANF